MRSLSRCSIWPVEMTRVVSAQAGKGKSKEDIQMSMHGVAYMDLASLLYPGATRVFGAYPVIGFSETDQSNRTDRRSIRSILDIVHPKPNATGEECNSVSVPVACEYQSSFLFSFICLWPIQLPLLQRGQLLPNHDPQLRLFSSLQRLLLENPLQVSLAS